MTNPIHIDFGPVNVGDLELRLEAKLQAQPEKNYLPAYRFGLLHRATGQRIGEIGLKIGDPPPDSGHIWYRVLPEHRGHHYATRALQLILPLAKHHAINPLRITCRTDNMASRRTCELAGASYIGTIQMPDNYRDWLGPVSEKCLYQLHTVHMTI